jgi:hypothetical protein
MDEYIHNKSVKPCVYVYVEKERKEGASENRQKEKRRKKHTQRKEKMLKQHITVLDIYISTFILFIGL